MRLLLAALSLAAGIAMAQAPKPAPAPAEERPVASSSTPTRPLNLKLDGPASAYTRDEPREAKGVTESLPTLGGDAMPMPNLPTPRPEAGRTPYPKDTTLPR